MAKIITTIIAFVGLSVLLINNPLYSQVTIKNKLILTGNLDSERQVEGISPNTSSLNQAVNVEIIQTNKLKYTEATGNGNNIDLTLNVFPQQYITGTMLYFKASQPNTSNVNININGLGYMPAYKDGNINLTGGEIIKDQIVQIIFIDDHFEILSSLNKTCPTGFKRVNSNYCIEIDEQTPASFYDAVKACGAKNAKLCRWDNWYFDCQKYQASGELNNMIDNWEWTDEGGNNLNYATSVYNTVHVAGEGGCTENFTRGIKEDTSTDFVKLPYRCCYKD